MPGNRSGKKKKKKAGGEQRRKQASKQDWCSDSNLVLEHYEQLAPKCVFGKNLIDTCTKVLKIKHVSITCGLDRKHLPTEKII